MSDSVREVAEKGITYIFRIILALVFGIIIASIVGVTISIIFGSEGVPSNYPEVVLREPDEFDAKVKTFKDKLHDKQENCIIKFKTVKDNTPVDIDFTKILSYRQCHSTTKCVETIDGKKYGITPGNSINMNESSLRYHIEGCGQFSRKGEAK